MDYRDIPREKYNKITCLEMAEHVGVRKFQEFLLQVKDLLEDDGLFFLQIAGLRRAWQYEDLIWGVRFFFIVYCTAWFLFVSLTLPVSRLVVIHG